MHIQLLRHATLVLTLNNLKLLVDPMFSPREAMNPIPNAGNQRRIPMVPLPLSDTELQALLTNIDAVIVTHTHGDHWDATAQAMLPKHIPVLCQPEDQETITQSGFSQVIPVHNTLTWHGLHITRTGGQHGTGETGTLMGPVSGFVLQTENQPVLYIAGDTIWCPEVASALQHFSPAVVVLNTGAPTFIGGDPITMDAEDVCQVRRSISDATIVAVHMEAINHCLLTRAALKAKLVTAGLDKQVLIPQDGDTLVFQHI